MRALPPLLVSDALDRPVAAGIFRAVVVLPKASFESLDPRRLRDVLVHECAHVARRDHLVGLLQRVAEVVFWPQPLLRLLDRELSRAREEICDNHVLRGGDRIAYAWTLLEAAEMADGPAPLSSVFGLLSSSWRLEDRIAGILDDGRDLMTHSNRRASILVTACFLATTAAFAGLAPAEDDPADGKGVSGAVDRMAEQLRQGPFERTPDDERAGLYLLDLADGKSTLITDEPAPGLTNCGSPRWSPDGRRILFDASPGKNWRETHMKSIDLGEDRLKITDLGFGNCPSFSPDGKEIAFLSNNDEGMGLALGIWIIQAEGQSRRPLDVYGSPQWSPDGRKILVVHFGSPVQSSILDVETGAETPLNFPGYRIHPSPRWAGPDTVVAAATSDEGTAIALFDVSNPDEAKVKEVLWKKGDRLDADPMYPVFSPATGRCVFVGKTDEGRALYSVQRGSFGPPRRAEERGFDGRLAGLEFSPDGRFLLYCSDRSPIKTP
jgi:Tol biopolymer transport system component